MDEHIDPANRNLLMWAIKTRVDPSAQLHMECNRWCTAVSPAGLTPDKRSIEDSTLGRVVMDACKPFRWRHTWDQMFNLSDINEEL